MKNGWTEIPNGIATNPDLMDGGIIDQSILSKKWFIIFNDDNLDNIEEIDTREQAFEIFEKTIANREIA